MSEDLFRLPKNKKEQKPKKKTSSVEGYRRKFIQKYKGKWITFLHPIHGKVPGKCINIEDGGFSEPGHIPDFKLTIEGRSKTKKNSIVVRLVESKAWFCDSMQQAINSCKDNG